jgi:hypothetical protein
MSGPPRATRERPALLRARERVRAPREEAVPTPPPSLDVESLIASFLGASSPSVEPVRIDKAKAAPVPEEAFLAAVVVGALERMAMLARHRSERPLGERPRIEARLLAQMDAIAEAGATPEELGAFAEGEGPKDPWMTWAAMFTLGSLEGEASLRAVEALIEGEALAGAEQAASMAEALLVAPHPGLPALARGLLASESPLGRVVGLEVLSRRGLLEPESASAAFEHSSPLVASAAIRAIARQERTAAAIMRITPGLRRPEREVAWEAARTLTRWGDRAAYLDVREGGPLATVLGPRALEILVMAGDLEDIAPFTELVRRVPATAEVLDAIARFGHPDSGAYLVHWLSEDGLARAASQALETLFGPLVGASDRGRPAAWREALALREPSTGIRCRRGLPWSAAAAFAECTSGGRPRQEIERRLDELAARTGVAAHVDLALWGPDAVTSLMAAAGARRATR